MKLHAYVLLELEAPTTGAAATLVRKRLTPAPPDDPAGARVVQLEILPPRLVDEIMALNREQLAGLLVMRRALELAFVDAGKQPTRTRGVCRRCGCTDTRACEPTPGYRCAWANESHTLCTACVGPRGRDRRELERRAPRRGVNVRHGDEHEVPKRVRRARKS